MKFIRRFTIELSSYRAIEHPSGFSLLELLIYMGVLSLIVLGVAAIFIAIQGGGTRSQVQSEVNSNLRFAVEKIEDDLRSATSITAPASLGAVSTTLTMSASGTTISYCVVSSTLRRQIGGACAASSDAITDPTVLVATSTFTRFENTNSVLNRTEISVQTDISMSYNGTGPEEQYSEEKITTTALRNF